MYPCTYQEINRINLPWGVASKIWRRKRKSIMDATYSLGVECWQDQWHLRHLKRKIWDGYLSKSAIYRVKMLGEKEALFNWCEKQMAKSTNFINTSDAKIRHRFAQEKISKSLFQSKGVCVFLCFEKILNSHKLQDTTMDNKWVSCLMRLMINIIFKSTRGTCTTLNLFFGRTS